MKTINLILVTLFILGMNNSCTGQSGKNEQTNTISAKGEVEVYYFHNTRRCATCNAVEDVTKATLKGKFDNEISFTSYNLEEAEGKEKATSLGIGGQTLLIVKGDTKINLTNEGFMYARSNPKKLEEILIGKINPLL